MLKFEYPKKETLFLESVYPDSFEMINSAPEMPICIAGSSVLKYICQVLLMRYHWNSNDNDIFILGCRKAGRNLFGKMLDVVYVKEKTPEELLLNFDLPICRAAMDFKRNFYISIQCLNAILTGKYFLPNYMKSPKTATKMMMIHYPRNKSNLEEFSSLRENLISLLCDRFFRRVEKYTGRGFSPIYRHTDEVKIGRAHV